MYTFNMLTKWMMYWILLSQSLNWPLVIGLPKPPVDSMMISSWRNRQLAADYHQTDTNDQYSKRLEHRLLNHVERHDASQRRHATPLLMHDLYHIRAQQHQQQNNQHEEQSHYPVKHNYKDIPFVSQMLSSSVVRNYYHQGQLNDKGILHDNVLYFDLSSEIPEDEIFDQGILRVYYHGLSTHDKAIGTSLVRVYLVTTRQSRMDYQLISQEKVASNASKWISIDVTSAIKNWFNKQHRNLGLKIEVINLHPFADQSSNKQHPNRLIKPDSNHRLRLRRHLNHVDNHDQWNQQRPILLIHSHDKTILHQRRKRATSNKKTTNKSRKGCKRHKLKVNFAAVGWNDWIIAPKDYDAYLCKGRCKFPLSQHMNATNHAIIQTIAHQQSSDSVPLPCCVPTELDPIPLLYIDAKGVSVLKSYKDMVVTQCGCR